MIVNKGDVEEDPFVLTKVRTLHLGIYTYDTQIKKRVACATRPHFQNNTT